MEKEHHEISLLRECIWSRKLNSHHSREI